MKRTATVLALMLTFSMGQSPVYAQDGINVQDMLKACENQEKWAQMLCFGYLTGVKDALIINCASFSSGHSPNRGMTSGAFNVGGSAVQQAFINWARNNPQHWNEVAYVGARSALVETWPCSR